LNPKNELDTFHSPGLGPLGRVDYGGVVLEHRPARREFIPADHLEPKVHLLKLVVGMSEELLEYLADSGVCGIVLETLGAGRVPPWWLPAIGRAIEHGVALVITSRTGAGRTVDSKGYTGAHLDLERLGCWFANGLNGPKARIKLMAALGTGKAQVYFAQECRKVGNCRPLFILVRNTLVPSLSPAPPST
jgi:L-asparaginase